MKKYLFGVRSEFNKHDLETKLELDFFLEIPNTKKQHKEVKEMKTMIDNKICPTTYKEAIEAFNFTSLNASLIALKYRVVSNNLTVHIITTEETFERKECGKFVELANRISSNKDFLKKSQIKF